MIFYGYLVIYGELVKWVVKFCYWMFMFVQVVGNVVGKNYFFLFIFCYWVIGVYGNLIGYGGGLECKIVLFELEGYLVSDFFWLF